MTHLLRHLRLLPEAVPTTSDAALLDRFARRQDQDAFAALVQRHGPMVLGLCRRLLGEAHAAEDAFQATFLILARKAGSVRRPEALAAWLYGVASRVARKARRGHLQRGVNLLDLPEPADPQPGPLAELAARELLAVLEEEVQRLPEAYRLPLVLCCLGGLSREEAAQRLGCPVGAVKGRLERGRRWLLQRLARRGVTPALAIGRVAVALRSALAVRTVQAAVAFAAGVGPDAAVSEEVVALARGGIEAMSVSKAKVALVVLALVGLSAAGVGQLAGVLGKAGPPAQAVAAHAPGSKPSVPGGAEERAGKKRAAEQERARAELEAIRVEAEQADRTLTEKVVKARQELAATQGRLREAEDDARRLREPDAEEVELREEAARLARDALGKAGAAEAPARLALQRRAEATRQRARELAERREVDRNKLVQVALKLRLELVRLEEDVGVLERKRDAVRQDAERSREAAAERLRLLEGRADFTGAEGRGRALDRRLEAIQRELSELRREVRRLRQGRKEEERRSPARKSAPAVELDRLGTQLWNRRSPSFRTGDPVASSWPGAACPPPRS